MPMQREVIRFDAEPVTVTLDKGPHGGIECHGQYGIDWRYAVNHGKAVMYLPSEAREALLQSGAVAGEDVAIRRLGKARWEVERIAPDLLLELRSLIVGCPCGNHAEGIARIRGAKRTRACERCASALAAIAKAEGH